MFPIHLCLSSEGSLHETQALVRTGASTMGASIRINSPGFKSLVAYK